MTHEGPNKIKQNGDYSPEINVPRARDAINRLLLKMSPDMDLETQKQQVIHHIEDRLWNLFPENQAALDQLIEELRSAHFSNKKEMVNKIANQIGSFMTAISSPKELETKFREMTTERHRWTTLNDILSYELYGDNEINLHVLTMLTKTPSEMSRLFYDGLHLLALQLETDQKLKSVRQIIGSSWINFDHPKIIEKMGFTIVERNEKEREATAVIDRDAFIARFAR